MANKWRDVLSVKFDVSERNSKFKYLYMIIQLFLVFLAFEVEGWSPIKGFFYKYWITCFKKVNCLYREYTAWHRVYTIFFFLMMLPIFIIFLKRVEKTIIGWVVGDRTTTYCQRKKLWYHNFLMLSHRTASCVPLSQCFLSLVLFKKLVHDHYFNDNTNTSPKVNFWKLCS